MSATIDGHSAPHALAQLARVDAHPFSHDKGSAEQAYPLLTTAELVPQPDPHTKFRSAPALLKMSALTHKMEERTAAANGQVGMGWGDDVAMLRASALFLID